MQRDDTLASRPSALASMLPTVHGADSLGYTLSLREQLRPGEKDSWAWLLDERWRGKAAMIRDPAIGMIEAALAMEGAGLLKFDDIANLSIEEIDAVIAILKQKKRNRHFGGLWETYDDAAKLMARNVVVVQSIFSPAIVCPSSDDLRHIAGLQKGGSGSSVIEIMRHAGGAASDGLRLSGA